MRVLGFVSIALIVLDFFLWLVGRVYWLFLTETYDFQSPVYKVVIGIGYVSTLCNYLTLLLLAIGLTLVAGRLRSLSGSAHQP